MFRLSCLLWTLLLSLTCFAQLANSPWPKIHQNNQNTGLGTGNGSQGQLLWKWTNPNTVSNPSLLGSPAVASDGSIWFCQDQGIIALNPDGSSHAGGSAVSSAVNSSPTIDNAGNVWFGTTTGTYLMNPQGVVKQILANSGDGIPSITLGADGTVYVLEPESLIALDSKYNLKWQVPVNASSAAPAIGPDGTIYIVVSKQVTSSSFAFSLASFNSDGSPKWASNSNVGFGPSATSAVVGGDGTIYFGSFGGFVAISSAGSTEWHFTSAGPVLSTPAIGPDNSIYFGGAGSLGGQGDVYAFLPDGTQKWSFAGDGSGCSASPAIAADGTVYIGSNAGNVYALDALGNLKWSYSTGAGVRLGSAAIGGDGTVYIGDSAGNLYALGAAFYPTGLSFSPNPVVGGNTVTGTVTIAQAAPSGGIEVSLVSSNPFGAVLSSSTVLVPAGATAATFSVTVLPATSTWTATITASVGSKSLSSTLTVDPPSLDFLTLTSTSVQGGTPVTGKVALNGLGSPLGTPVNLSSNTPSAVVPSFVVVASNAESANFTVTTSGVDSTTTASITAQLGAASLTIKLQITPPVLQSLTVAPSTVTGGANATGTVTLSGQAGPSGVKISLQSSSTSAQPPTSVTVPAGATSVNFNIPTSPVSSQVAATMTATWGTAVLTAPLTIQTPLLTGLSMSPSAVTGGNSATGTITLGRAAPTGGAVISLSATAGAAVPASVPLPAGSTTGTFTVTTSGVAATTNATITATNLLSSQTASLTINPAILTSLTFTGSNTVAGGNPVQATVTLSGPAPSSGLAVGITSSSKVAAVPATVQVPAGASFANFTVTTTPVTKQTSATIAARFGLHVAEQILTITPPSIIALNFEVGDQVVGDTLSITGGSQQVLHGVVNLSGPVAASATIVVTLKSSNSSLASFQSSVSIAAGKSSGTFAINQYQVTSTKAVTLTATSPDGAKALAWLTLTPFLVKSLSLSPTPLVEGSTSVGTVTLNAQPATQSVEVELSSNAACATVPTSIHIPAGSTSGTFNITTTFVASATKPEIIASVGSSSANCNLTVQPPSIQSVALSASSISGGKSVSGTITLTGPAGPVRSQGIVITLSSNSSYASPTKSVTISPGSKTASFTVSTTKVTTQSVVAITAQSAFGTGTANLTILPTH